uniref:Uncharacterized protein n=1 Tax=Peronospora matthiolae TaxID=2874970 RepID=A0AAV1UIL3_9STRA
MTTNPPTDTTSGGKRPRLQYGLGHDVQKHPKRKGNLAAGVPRIPMCSQTQSTHATLPDTGIGHEDDVASVISRSETEDTHAYRSASVVAGVPVAVHKKLVFQVKGLQETLGKTYCMLDAMEIRLQAMERAQTRSEAQLDFLIRLQQSGAPLSSSAPEPQSLRGKNTGTA